MVALYGEKGGLQRIGAANNILQAIISGAFMQHRGKQSRKKSTIHGG